MQHQAQLEVARTETGYDYSDTFSAVSEAIRQADLAVVNLEAPLGGAPYRGYPLFCAPDAFAAALRDAGFDLFLTANNHILDRGERGLSRTLDVLDSLQVLHTGSYRTAEERARFCPLLFSCHGIRLAILNYTYATNGMTISPPASVNYLHREQIELDLQQARNLGAELIIVCLHWGEEYRQEPTPDQRELARFLVNRGAHLVIGSHPHVLQPIELLRRASGEPRALIAYSLGNFISNMKIRHTTGGALLKVRIRKDKRGTRIDTACYSLLFTQRAAADGSPCFRLLPASESRDTRRTFPGWVEKEMNQFFIDARTLFQRQNRDVTECHAR